MAVISSASGMMWIWSRIPTIPLAKRVAGALTMATHWNDSVHFKPQIVCLSVK